MNSLTSGGKALFLTCSILVTCSFALMVHSADKMIRTEITFLPIVTSVVCESCSATKHASESARSSSLPGRSAIDERSPQLIHRVRSRPNERFLHHPLRRQHQHRQPRRQLLQLRRELPCRDSQAAVAETAAVIEYLDLSQPFRLRVLPRSLRQQLNLVRRSEEHTSELQSP